MCNIISRLFVTSLPCSELCLFSVTLLQRIVSYLNVETIYEYDVCPDINQAIVCGPVINKNLFVGSALCKIEYAICY